MTDNKKCIFIGIGVAIVALLGSVFTRLGREWYSSQELPSQWPPNFLFPIVWSAIYLLMFIALCSVVKMYAVNSRYIITLAIINGALNVLWCGVFFGLGLTFVGLIVIILNLFASIFLVNALRINGEIYYYMTLIYPVWVSIATALNCAVWILN